MNRQLLVGTLIAAAAFGTAFGADAPTKEPPPPPGFDAALAAKLGADEHGMKQYVLVILKTGPNKHPAGKERDEIFNGHFANMGRLAAEGRLAVAGPLDGVDGWRGLFIVVANEVDEAKQLAESDPVLKSGEMVAEYHKLFSSAALMQVNETHGKIAKRSF
jgi:uncharacterized protein YciI